MNFFRNTMAWLVWINLGLALLVAVTVLWPDSLSPLPVLALQLSYALESILVTCVTAIVVVRRPDIAGVERQHLLYRLLLLWQLGAILTYFGQLRPGVGQQGKEKG
jgi:hypothetical protein